ncbi:MAG: M81 family metallopeptidase [Planctomycetes bacterium]|nr:M81 family metallopeptidase [Planctomycetota bacterium]
MRIAIGGILHETSTFVETRTTLDDFEYDRGIARGREVIERFRGTNVCTGGFLESLERHGAQPVPLLRASAFPGGLIPAGDYAAMKDEMLERLDAAEREGGPVDGVLLDLHGAMVVEGIDDGDGDVLAAFRERLGPVRPLIATFDLHGNHTRRRIAAATAIVGFDTFPHVDMAERGREAGEIIIRTLRGEIRPVAAIHQLPLFWSTPRQATSHPPMDEVIRRLHELERRRGIISATVSTGFPWSDVPEVGASVIAIADSDRGLAQRTADEFAAWIWERRRRWYQGPVSVREALEAGHRAGRFPIVLADHADNTGGGSPGDSTEVLRTFLELGLSDALLLYMVDHEAARAGHAAGVGRTVRLSLGGKSHPVQGPPIDCEAEVVALSTGEFAYDGPMWAGLTGSMGLSAWLKIGGVSVVVVTAREQPFDMAFARSLGIDCRTMKYIALKSAAHFRAAFEPIAGSIHNVDAAAIHTHDFTKLVYRKRIRPVFPVEIAFSRDSPEERG